MRAKLKKIASRKRISEGDDIPKGYGIAWVDFLSMEAVCYPMGLNFMARWFRDAKYWIKDPFSKGDVKHLHQNPQYLEAQLDQARQAIHQRDLELVQTRTAWQELQGNPQFQEAVHEMYLKAGNNDH